MSSLICLNASTAWSTPATSANDTPVELICVRREEGEEGEEGGSTKLL
jgi:hypothetical protein